jgi:hypothetical protein
MGYTDYSDLALLPWSGTVLYWGHTFPTVKYRYYCPLPTPSAPYGRAGGTYKSGRYRHHTPPQIADIQHSRSVHFQGISLAK